MLKIKVKIKVKAENTTQRRIQAENYRKGGKGKITKAPPLSNLPPVVDIDSLDCCTLAHNRIAPLLL
jgi:hypothetical protein